MIPGPFASLTVQPPPGVHGLFFPVSIMYAQNQVLFLMHR